MENNEKYNNQMISIDTCLFCIIDNNLNVLLIKRASEPHKNMWGLVGGKVYNDETCENAVIRELNEKLNIAHVNPVLFGVFSDPKRDERFRNISISYYSFLDYTLITNLNSNKIIDAQWFNVSEIPKLAFDHNNILSQAIKELRNKVYDMNYMKPYLPQNFTLSTLQKIYESILNVNLDKRNFRRKLTSLNCLINTGNKNENDTHKKSTLYSLK